MKKKIPENCRGPIYSHRLNTLKTLLWLLYSITNTLDLEKARFFGVILFTIPEWDKQLRSSIFFDFPYGLVRINKT